MTNKNLLVANWKMNLGPSKSAQLARDLRELANGLKKTEIWVAPSPVCLPAVLEQVKGSGVRSGAQNVHWAATGAFTGEVSVPMLQELSADFAITGHSERRHQFGETNELVVKRSLGALSQGLGVIHCIGEKLDERERGETNAVLARQLEPLFAEARADSFGNLVIAYEPVWAIGTGKVASVEEIREAHAFISGILGKYGAAACPVLYGGSVTPENYAGIIALDLVNGALVGGASLTLEGMRKLAEISEG
jgi:triosephosphate isomerase (TIM)